MEPNTIPSDTTDTANTTDSTDTIETATTASSEQNQPAKPFLSYVILAVIAFLVVTFLYNRKKNEPTAAPEGQSAIVPAPSSANPAMDAAKDKALNDPGFDSYLNLGLVYYKDGQFQYCINATLKALEYSTTADKQAVAYNNLCSSYNQLSMFDEAINACQKSISLSPDFQLAKNNLKAAMAAKKE